jgi:hypothetical protein
MKRKYNYANSEFLKNSTKLVQYENQVTNIGTRYSIVAINKSDAIESNKVVNEAIRI